MWTIRITLENGNQVYGKADVFYEIGNAISDTLGAHEGVVLIEVY